MRKLFALVTTCILFGVITSQPALADNAVIGVNIVNPYNLSLAEQDAMLEAMKSAGVRVIRASITPDDNGVAFAHRASEHGIKIEALIFRFGGYNEGAPSLAAADPEKFRASFAPLLAKLEGKGITLAAFELGNEINFTINNGEAPLPGKGMQFSLNDLYHDPEGQQIAKGYLQYLKILAVLKDIRDHSKLNQHTPILTAGLGSLEEDEGPLSKSAKSWFHGDIVSVKATFQYMRANGLDNLVDAYAVHVYPWGNGPGDPTAAAGRRDRLAKYILNECRPTGNASGKPCWITEWGFKNTDMTCPTNDASRTMLVREMMGNFRPYVQQGSLAGLLYFSWNDVPGTKDPSPLTIYRCGTLTQSGKLSIDADLIK